MPIHIERGDFDPQRGRFQYFVCFTRNGLDDDDIRSRVPVEMSVSVSENGELADMSFQLPKNCRQDQALALLSQEPAAQAVDSRVFISIPGLNGDAVIKSAAELQLDAAGRIVGIHIHPF